MSTITQWIQGMDLTYFIERLMVAAAAVLSICVHESSHGLAALWLGDDTAKRMGRITLNPLKHLDVVGLLMMIFAGFGWAKPVPVDMRRFKNPKTGMALTALAGPLSNVLLAFVLLPFYYVAYSLLTHTYSQVWYWVSIFFRLAVSLNASLAVFNLLPISPLDGSKILAIVLPEEWYYKLMRYERYGMLVLMALLFTGVLSTPLGFLRDGLISVLEWLWTPLRYLLFRI